MRLDELDFRPLLLALASGAAATVALLLSPQAAEVGPLLIPYTPIDLRFVGLPLTFAFLHLAFSGAKWPRPALVLPALALSAAAAAHFQGSALLGLFTQLVGSQAGDRVDLLRTFASGASLVLALAAALDRGRDRLAALADEAGVPEEQLVALHRAAGTQAQRTLGFTAAAFVALALVASIGDAWLGRAEAPLPELVGAVVAVGVAALLFPGLAARRADAPP